MTTNNSELNLKLTSQQQKAFVQQLNRLSSLPSNQSVGEFTLTNTLDINEYVLSLLELKSILAWAKSLPEDTVVGYTQALIDCPVYQYLKDAGVQVEMVTPYNILGSNFEITEKQIPASISRLISAIDESLSTNFSICPVTAIELIRLFSSLQ